MNVPPDHDPTAGDEPFEPTTEDLEEPAEPPSGEAPADAVDLHEQPTAERDAVAHTAVEPGERDAIPPEVGEPGELSPAEEVEILRREALERQEAAARLREEAVELQEEIARLSDEPARLQAEVAELWAAINASADEATVGANGSRAGETAGGETAVGEPAAVEAAGTPAVAGDLEETGAAEPPEAGPAEAVDEPTTETREVTAERRRRLFRRG